MACHWTLSSDGTLAKGVSATPTEGGVFLGSGRLFVPVARGLLRSAVHEGRLSSGLFPTRSEGGEPAIVLADTDDNQHSLYFHSKKWDFYAGATFSDVSPQKEEISGWWPTVEGGRIISFDGDPRIPGHQGFITLSGTGQAVATDGKRVVRIVCQSGVLRRGAPFTPSQFAQVLVRRAVIQVDMPSVGVLWTRIMVKRLLGRVSLRSIWPRELNARLPAEHEDE